MPETNNTKDLNIKPHNQLYWKNRKAICKNSDCRRTKGMTPEQITEAGIPHQGYGYCSTCYGVLKKEGKLESANKNYRQEEIKKYKLIGERIRLAREIQGISVRKLAKDVGYRSTSSLTYIETGQKRMQLTELEKLSGSLKRDMNYFFGLEATLPDFKTFLKDCYRELDTEDIEEIEKFVQRIMKSKQAEIILKQLAC